MKNLLEKILYILIGNKKSLKKKFASNQEVIQRNKQVNDVEAMG